jgi:hypothetical protein
MIKKSMILFFAGLSMNIFASVSLESQEYRFGILNRQIHIPADLMTYGQILKFIQAATGYDIINKVEEIPFDKKFVGLSRYHILGDLLNEVLKGYDAVVDVDEVNHIIKIIYPETVYIDLPYGWPMEKVKSQFKQLFPYVNFYIEGNRLTAYGIPRDIAKLVPYFKTYQENAYKKDSFRVALYPYCTHVKKYVFLARRKYSGSEEFKPLKSLTASLGQNEKVAISYRDINVNITYDKADNIVRIGKYEIPISDLSKMGLAFRVFYKKDDDSFIDQTKKVLNFVLNGQKETAHCNDVIVVIDKGFTPY